MQRRVLPQTLITVQRTSAARVIGKLPLLTVRERVASTSRGVIVDGGIVDLTIVAPHAENGAIDKNIVGSWR